jgi:steroid 5-alpha reductase family enzyme
VPVVRRCPRARRFTLREVLAVDRRVRAIVSRLPLPALRRRTARPQGQQVIEILRAIGASALVIWFYVTAWFALSLALKRNDVADVAWGLGPTVLGWWLFVRTGEFGATPLLLVTVLVSVWGARLAWHVAARDFAPGRGEDPRYAAWREEWRYFTVRSYLQVFLLQGFFMLLVSMPLIVLASWPAPALPVLTVVGAALWFAGFGFESIADRQLAAFLTIPREARPPVMDRGLWAWSRHPNYFGESLMWWGLAIVALGVPYGWLGLIGPVTITLLLVFVSGIPLVERRHAGEPDWDAYKQRTSAFLPMPPRKS